MTFEEVYNPLKKRLWDRKNVALGIITSEKLPPEVSLKFITLLCGNLKCAFVKKLAFLSARFDRNRVVYSKQACQNDCHFPLNKLGEVIVIVKYIFILFL